MPIADWLIRMQSQLQSEIGNKIMSRIGKKPISLPKGVTVTVHEQELEVKGPKGTLKTPIPAGINFQG